MEALGIGLEAVEALLAGIEPGYMVRAGLPVLHEDFVGVEVCTLERLLHMLRRGIHPCTWLVADPGKSPKGF